MKCSLILSISPSLCLNHVTWLSPLACRLCLLCRYPLAPSHFDKLGHENKPPRCQENAKYRASFLWQCLFNQLPLISALHPLFLSFQNVMEEKSVHRQRLLLSTLLLLRPRSLVHSPAFAFLSLPQSLPFLLPTCFFSAVLYLFSVSFPHSFLALSLSPLAYLPLASPSFFFAASHPSFPSSFCVPSPFLDVSLFHPSLLSISAIVLLPSLKVLQCVLTHQAAW